MRWDPQRQQRWSCWCVCGCRKQSSGDPPEPHISNVELPSPAERLELCVCVCVCLCVCVCVCRGAGGSCTGANSEWTKGNIIDIIIIIACLWVTVIMIVPRHTRSCLLPLTPVYDPSGRRWVVQIKHTQQVQAKCNATEEHSGTGRPRASTLALKRPLEKWNRQQMEGLRFISEHPSTIQFNSVYLYSPFSQITKSQSALQSVHIDIPDLWPLTSHQIRNNSQITLQESNRGGSLSRMDRWNRCHVTRRTDLELKHIQWIWP